MLIKCSSYSSSGPRSSPQKRGKEEEEAPQGASPRKRRKKRRYPSIGEQWGEQTPPPPLTNPPPPPRSPSREQHPMLIRSWSSSSEELNRLEGEKLPSQPSSLAQSCPHLQRPVTGLLLGMWWTEVALRMSPQNLSKLEDLQDLRLR